MGGPGGDSCRLIIVNPFSCVIDPFTTNAHFGFNLWETIVSKGQRLNDDLVDLELESIERIIVKIQNDPESDYMKQCELKTWKDLYKSGYEGRRTGLGITALSDTLAALGMKYDSDDALSFTEKLMKHKCLAEWLSSTTMAKERGPFPIWDREIDEKSEFIQMLKQDVYLAYSENYHYGRRNISLSTVAPAGSVSILTQTSSGIEPVYELEYIRRRKLQHSDEQTDFIDIKGDRWQEYAVKHPQLKEWQNKNPDLSIEESPYFGCTAHDINWKKRIDLQGVTQKYTTHSISSTINLPEDISVETVKDLYFYAWKAGLKGVTIYRDKCRDGVLISNNKNNEMVRFHDTHAPKRPNILEARAITFWNAEDDNNEWIGVTGLYDGKPYEVFTGRYENHKFDLNEKLYIERRKKENKNKYYLIQDNQEADLGYISKKEFVNYQKLLSGVLRHGMSIQYVLSVVENLTCEKESLFTWKQGIIRLLKSFIEDGILSKEQCPECDQSSLVYQSGCKYCYVCGFSKC